VCESVNDSLPDGGPKVDSLSHALPNFLEPSSWISAMNHAPQKAQPLGCIIAVSPDIVLRDLGVQSEKGTRDIEYGRQTRTRDGANLNSTVFVLPSTSGSAKKYWDPKHWRTVADEFRALWST